jgi:flagellar hook-basal body complex protein FliE
MQFGASKMNSIDPGRLAQLRSSIISQNDALRRAAGEATPAPTENGPIDFSRMVADAVGRVNDQQGRASEASAAYERGETNDIVAVMIERQKASIGFETTLQVRNKLLSAYRDIMSMPV